VALLEAANDNVEVLLEGDDSGFGGVTPELTYAEIGAVFREPPANDRQRRMLWEFWRTTAKILRHFRDRADAIERQLDALDRERLRATLKVVEGEKR
jgi:hypothetical protein